MIISTQFYKVEMFVLLSFSFVFCAELKNINLKRIYPSNTYSLCVLNPFSLSQNLYI